MKRGTRGIRSLGSATSMATRLAGAILMVSLVSLLIATVVGLTAGRDLGRDLYEDRLLAMRAGAVGDVEAHMNSLVQTAEALSASPQAGAATEAFATGLDDLGALTPTDIEDEIVAVVEEYQTRYVDPLLDAGREVALRDLVPMDPAALHLQYEYAVDLGPVRQPSAVSDARDGSAWSEVHAQVHPVYRDVVNRLELIDLYLVEPDDLKVVYSVRKRADLGTSLRTGPFSGSATANAVDRVVAEPDAGTVISDLRYYAPSITLPVGVTASPILDGDRLEGVLVLMYDSTPITRLLTADQSWDEAGFPDTGETYLIGADGRVRSEPRTWLEDPNQHLDLAAANGLLTEPERQTIETADTTVLTQRAVGSTVAAIDDGDDSVAERSTIVGTDAFGTVTPVEIDDLGWTVAAEIGVETAEGDLVDFQQLLVVGAAIFVVLLAFAAVAWANALVRPVRVISNRLGSQGRDDAPVNVPDRSPMEFHQLADNFEAMSAALDDRKGQLAQARDDRVALLRRLLPRTAAERVASGDGQRVEEIGETSVVVAVIRGLDEPIDTRQGDRALVDELLGELDELAELHRLERVKIVGDAYSAACGHDRPLIDHALRATAFAVDAQNAIDQALGGAGHLRSSLAVASGVVSVGMTGASGLVYDVWGPTVTHAHRLARRAEPGTVLVSDETRRRLPPTTGVEQVDDGWKLDPMTGGGS